MIKKILKENKWYIISIIVLIVILTILMKSSFSDVVMKIDSNVILFMNNIVDNLLTNIIIVCIFIFFKNKLYFYILSCGYAFSGAITYLSKLLIGRARPVSALIDIPKSFSFPSGHTLTSIVFYVLLCYLLVCNKSKKTKIICLTLSILFVMLIALSRVYLGVHYFSDVIGGFIIGILSILLIINIVKKNFKEKLL